MSTKSLPQLSHNDDGHASAISSSASSWRRSARLAVHVLVSSLSQVHLSEASYQGHAADGAKYAPRLMPRSLTRRKMRRSDLLRELALRIATVSRPHPVRVAIDGVDAAGKTSLADELVAPLKELGLPVIRVSIDRFHNSASVRKQRGADSPEGYYRDSFNYAGLIEAVLAPLGPGGTGRFRRAIFDYRTDAAVDAPCEEAPARAVLLFDGVFLLRPELRAYWDFSIFVHADFATTVGRAERRDRESFGSASEVRRKYQARYVPGQQLYLREVAPQQLAALVVDNNDPADPQIRHPPANPPLHRTAGLTRLREWEHSSSLRRCSTRCSEN